MGRWIFDILFYPLRAMFSLARLGTASRRLLGVSLPARVAWLVALFLVVSAVSAYILFYYTQNRTSWSYWASPWRITLIVAMVVVIPLVVYQALRLWLQGDVSRFPDIDYAWKAGLAELQRQGLDLGQTPLFVIIGSSGVAQEKALFDASRLDLRIREAPAGPAALHWYANPEGIYLSCSEAGCLGKLSKATLTEEESRVARPLARPDAVRGTIVGGAASAEESAPAIAPARREMHLVAPAAAPTRGTMMMESEPQGLPGAPSASAREAAALLPADALEQEQRLEYVCHLIRRERQPLSPVNGIVVLVPYALLERGSSESAEVQRSLQRDVVTARRALEVRCPATVLVVGLEAESGFRELVRRVGRERAAGQRFGKGFATWNPPTVERLQALSAHACGAVEDWVYNLFREKGSLSKPGNTKLYMLLCKIRRHVQGRLSNALLSAFAPDPQHDPEIEPFLFSGCYFGAAGETDDRQAFVKGVLDKLPEQQEELQWMGKALREDRRYRGWAQVLFAVDFLLLAALAAMIFFRWLR